MVQYKTVLKGHKEEPYEREYRSNAYWKLGFYINKTVPDLKKYLATRGYRYPKGATKAVLMDAVGRCQRGLLSYETCNANELRAFCKVRNISSPPKPKTVSQLARILEQADDDATFPRFLELPAELRNKINEFHFRSYGEISTQHRQPPLTLVPQIRAEALPVFYKCVTFTWDLSMDTNFCFYAHTYTGSSYRLLNMPAGNMAQIRNFKLHWTRVSRGSMGATMRAVDFSVHMAQGSTATKTVDIYGKVDAQALQEIEDVVRSVNGKIEYEILD